MGELLTIFGLILLFFASGFFLAWRMEVRERRQAKERDSARAA